MKQLCSLWIPDEKKSTRPRNGKMSERGLEWKPTSPSESSVRRY